jgi:hypothetical protein
VLELLQIAGALLLLIPLAFGLAYLNGVLRIKRTPSPPKSRPTKDEGPGFWSGFWVGRITDKEK